MTYLYTFGWSIWASGAKQKQRPSQLQSYHGREKEREIQETDGGHSSSSRWKLLLWTEGKKNKTNPPQTPRLPLDVCWRFAQALARECVEALFFPFSLPLPFQHLAEPLIQVNSRRFNPVTKRETKCCLNKRLWAVNGRAVRKAGFDPRSGGKLHRRSLWKSAGRRSQL